MPDAVQSSPWDVVSSSPPPPAAMASSSASPWDIVDSKPQSSDDGGFLHQAWEDGFVNPARQVAAGYFRSAEGTAHLLGNAADLAGKITGTQPGGFFRDAEKTYGREADEYSGGRKDVASQIYQGIGAAPGEVAKYMAAGETLGPVAGMAATDALSASDKGAKAALTAGAKGALTGAALGVMAPASTTARVTGGAAMFGGETAVSGGSPYDIVASAVTGGAMGGAGGAEKETPRLESPSIQSGPFEDMPSASLSQLLQVETDPAKRADLVAEAE
ncbi:MAG: hypothetical protein ACRD5L_07540, partial [Bryobacteraceae bacterium]